MNEPTVKFDKTYSIYERKSQMYVGGVNYQSEATDKDDLVLTNNLRTYNLRMVKQNLRGIQECKPTWDCVVYEHVTELIKYSNEVSINIAAEN